MSLVYLSTRLIPFEQIYYLRQVNEVNGGYSVHSMCVCLCVRSGPVNQTSLKWALNASRSEAVKATNFKFDVHVSRDSPDMTPYEFF